MAADPGKAILAGGLLLAGYFLYKSGTLSKLGLPVQVIAAGKPGVPNLQSSPAVASGVPGLMTTNGNIQSIIGSIVPVDVSTPDKISPPTTVPVPDPNIGLVGGF